MTVLLHFEDGRIQSRRNVRSVTESYDHRAVELDIRDKDESEVICDVLRVEIFFM